jgi:DNA-binding NarL/FixJ family response regulator
VSEPARKPRLFLVDDHRMVLEGLRLALRKEYDIVGMTAMGASVLEACRDLRPDAVLLDLSLPDRSGLEVIGDLKAELPEIRIVVVTMHSDRIMADASLQSGAHGFVPKDAGMEELKLALTQVLAGRRFISDLVPRDADRSAAAGIAPGLAKLTPRRRQIVRLLGEGRSTREIAAELSLAPATITFHRARIRDILGIESEWDLVRYAWIVRMSEKESERPR